MATYGPQLVAGDLIQVTAWNQMEVQAGLNNHYYVVLDLAAPGLNPLSAIGDGLVANGMPDAYKAIMSAAASYLGMVIRRVSPALTIPYYDSTGTGVGLVAGDPLPRQIAGLIRWRSSIPGKRRSGRTFIPFPAEADNTTGVAPSAGYLGRAAVLASAVKSNITWAAGVGRAVRVIFHRALPSVSPTIVSSAIANAWATQRRRGTLGRPNSPPF